MTRIEAAIVSSTPMPASWVPSHIGYMPRTAITVTALVDFGRPCCTCNGSHGERSSFSAKQQVTLPGHAWVDFS
jgi:hypothetical protein